MDYDRTEAEQAAGMLVCRAISRSRNACREVVGNADVMDSLILETAEHSARQIERGLPGIAINETAIMPLAGLFMALALELDTISDAGWDAGVGNAFAQESILLLIAVIHAHSMTPNTEGGVAGVPDDGPAMDPEVLAEIMETLSAKLAGASRDEVGGLDQQNGV